MVSAGACGKVPLMPILIVSPLDDANVARLRLREAAARTASLRRGAPDRLDFSWVMFVLLRISPACTEMLLLHETRGC